LEKAKDIFGIFHKVGILDPNTKHADIPLIFGHVEKVVGAPLQQRNCILGDGVTSRKKKGKLVSS
jgi:hypothetical protein